MKWIKNNFESVINILMFIALVILIVIIVFGISISLYKIEKMKYEYVDLDNNKGIAKKCSYEYEGYHSGGQGSPVCILEDGTVLSVKQYKSINNY